jgi:hypothetical protein
MTEEVLAPSQSLGGLLTNKRAFLGRHRGGDLSASQLTYVAIRPTNELDDHTVSGLIDEYEEVQLQVGEADYPSYVAATYYNAVDAIRDALGIRAAFPHVKLYYNGLELLWEFDSWRSLAQLIHGVDDEWGVAEEIASGNKNIGDLDLDDYSDVLWAVLMEIAQEIDQQQGGK